MNQEVQELFGKFGSIKVGVIGDVMLDTYMWGEVDRISPEAPVPIVAMRKKECRIGGAGNVALNLQSLGAKAYIISVTGEDEEAKQLDALFNAHKIDTSYSISSGERVTTNKTRIISRNQQMMRLDAEITHDLSAGDEARIIESFRKFIRNEKPQVVILEDYNKGVLTREVIHSVIRICKEEGVITTVDPKRRNFFEYRGVDIFKPNLKEVKDALNLLVTEVNASSLQHIHKALHSELDHAVSLITLSEKGIFYQRDEEAAIIPTHVRTIADVSGAGDTVIAVASLVYAATRNVLLTAEVANIAGGLVCEEVGTAAINRQKLEHECELLLG